MTGGKESKRVSTESLGGRWRVERLGGALPPMWGVSKQIWGTGGVTWFGPLPLMPFRVESWEGGVALLYRGPFSMLRDEIRAEADGSWVGRVRLGGRELGRFRMVRDRR